VKKADEKFYFNVEQSRAVNTEDSFFNDIPYPSPYEYDFSKIVNI
jgi:hypothetical protein